LQEEHKNPFLYNYIITLVAVRIKIDALTTLARNDSGLTKNWRHSAYNMYAMTAGGKYLAKISPERQFNQVVLP